MPPIPSPLSDSTMLVRMDSTPTPRDSLDGGKQDKGIPPLATMSVRMWLLAATVTGSGCPVGAKARTMAIAPGITGKGLILAFKLQKSRPVYDKEGKKKDLEEKYVNSGNNT